MNTKHIQHSQQPMVESNVFYLFGSKTNGQCIRISRSHRV